MSSTPVTSAPPKAPSYSVATLADGAIVMDDTFNKVATVHKGNGQGVADAFRMAQKFIQALTVPATSNNSGLTLAEITKDRDQWKDQALRFEGQNSTQAKSVADLTRQCEGYRKTIDDISKTRDGYAKDIDNLARQCEGYRRTIDDVVKTRDDLSRLLETSRKATDTQTNAVAELKRQLDEAKKATPATAQHAAYVPIEYRRVSDKLVVCSDKTGGIVPAPNDVVAIEGYHYRVVANCFNYDATGRQVGVTTWVASD